MTKKQKPCSTCLELRRKAIEHAKRLELRKLAETARQAAAHISDKPKT